MGLYKTVTQEYVIPWSVVLILMMCHAILVKSVFMMRNAGVLSQLMKTL